FGGGSYDEARAAIAEGLAANPKDLELLRLEGSVLMAMHDLPGALAAYQAYLAAGATGAKKRQVEALVKDLLPVLTTSLDITAVKLTPGRHVVAVAASGHTPARREVDAHAGEPVTVEVALVPAAPEPAKPDPAAALAASAAAGSSRRSTGRRVATLVLGGVAV